jgi:hypothetical protein
VPAKISITTGTKIKNNKEHARENCMANFKFFNALYFDGELLIAKCSEPVTKGLITSARVVKN